MPIMGPLAQQLGFSPEVMVQICCGGNGLVNLFTPTSGAIMGGLALARVQYSTWLKFAWKAILVIGHHQCRDSHGHHDVCSLSSLSDRPGSPGRAAEAGPGKAALAFVS